MPSPPPYRCVERHALYAKPLSFQSLCRRHIPNFATHIVLDLDRTVHLDHNLSELVGWELVLQSALGEQTLERYEASRAEGRTFLGWTRPLRGLKAGLIGTQRWGDVAGEYLFWIHSPWGAKRSWRRFIQKHGEEPLRSVQRAAQSRLFGLLAELSPDTSKRIVDRVLHRHRFALTIEPSDIKWLRQHAPRAKIAICSAAPEIVARQAAQFLGVDIVLAATVPADASGTFTPIYEVARQDVRPRRLAMPDQIVFNAGSGKVARLEEHFGDWNAQNAFCVGITDTTHGDDHSWSQVFDVLIDVNSNAPFSPIVPRHHRVKELISAPLMSRRDKVELAAGQPLRPNPNVRHGGSWSRQALEVRFEAQRARLTSIAKQLKEMQPHSNARALLGREQALLYLGVLTERYNQSTVPQKSRLLPLIRTEVLKLLEAERSLAKVPLRRAALLAEEMELRKGARLALASEQPPSELQTGERTQTTIDLHEVALSAAL